MQNKVFNSVLSILSASIFLISCAQNANFKTVSPQEFQKFINDKNTILVDVRTPEEVSEGKISNAINIDFYSSTFEQEISKLNNNKTILVYGTSGKRSSEVANILVKKGFKVINLNGGITNWISNGLPVQK